MIEENELYKIIEIPNSAILKRAPGEENGTFAWETGYSPCKSQLVDNSLLMLIEKVQETNKANGCFWSLGGGNVTPSYPDDWVFEATINNFSKKIKNNQYLRTCIAGDTARDSINPYICGTWFTGFDRGTFYENVLFIKAFVLNDFTKEIIDSKLIMLEGISPDKTLLDFKIIIDDETKFTAWYRLNNNEWQKLWENINEGTMSGFPDLKPLVSIKTGSIPPVTLPWLMLLLGN